MLRGYKGELYTQDYQEAELDDNLIAFEYKIIHLPSHTTNVTDLWCYSRPQALSLINQWNSQSGGTWKYILLT